MKLCNESVTFFVLGAPDENGYDSYTEVTVNGCSWFRQTDSEINAKGRTPDNSVIIRIPAENVPDGLKLTKGMKVTHGEETVYIKAWTDNRRALRGKHIKVVCA